MAPEALPAHYDHGDTLGSCDESARDPVTTAEPAETVLPDPVSDEPVEAIKPAPAEETPVESALVEPVPAEEVAPEESVS